MQHLDRSVSPRTKRMVERALKPLSRVVAKYKRQADSLEGKNHGFLMLPSEIEDTHILMEKLGRLKRELHESVRLIDIDERGFKEIFQHTQSRTTPGRIKTFFSRPNPFEEVVSRASNGLIHALGLVSVLLATQFPVVFVVPVYAVVCTLRSLLVSRRIIEARPFLYIGHVSQKLTAMAQEPPEKVFNYFKQQLGVTVDRLVAECENVLSSPVMPKTMKPERQ